MDGEEHRWVCPICKKSRRSTTRRGALNALRAHIYATDGGGHGPRRAWPDGLTDETTTANVERIFTA